MRKFFVYFASTIILGLSLLATYDAYNHDLQHAIFDIVIAILFRLETNELKNLKK